MTQKKDIKIIFWGTSEFAMPTLEALIKDDYNVVAVITNPDEPAGRKQVLTSPPVKMTAEKYGVQVFQPENLKSDFPREVRLPDIDLFIVAAYGKIIPKEILDIPRYGALNIHPSLLPRWRGPSPIQYTILNGDTETGVTIMKMDEKMDHGPIVAKSKIQISKSKITYLELHDNLAKLGADLLIETLPKYLTNEIIPISQDESKAAYSKILKKEDGRIDWIKPAEEIERMVRAFTPWPSAWTTWQGRRVRIDSANLGDEESKSTLPGLVWKNDSGSLLVSTGKGSLLIETLTVEGGKTLSGGAFLRGHSSIIGAVLQ